jgi:serine/threonine protein kinase/Tol biopolymer transport system component
MAGSPDVLSGTFAGRYTIERELGSGATATVYLARDTQRGIAVAVKLLRPELAESVGAERFLREIRLNEKLHHPHIVPVLDSGEHAGRLYFVLPQMEDGSLRQLLQREKQLPIETAIAITRTIAEALDYAHKQNLIHRDVKPENILFTSGQACLADFGIARAVERALDQSTTESGMVRGTPAYMSPEQASGSRQYDGRSDQYSLACVLYEMLAGVPAFIGPTPEAVIAQRFQHPPRELRVYRPSVPPSIEAAITKALAIAPADRFASAAEFGVALQTTAASLVEPRVSGPSVTLTRSRMLAFAGAALVFTVAAVAVGSSLASTFRNRDAVVNFVVPPPTGAQFADNLRDVSAVSPDGRHIIIAGTDSSGVRHLWRRPLSERTATPISGTERGSKAFWSPDGSSIGFFRDRSLTIVGVAGGLPKQLPLSAGDSRGGSWADNGTILYAPGTQSGIFGVSLEDTTSRQLTRRRPERGEIGHMWPHALPGGRAFLYFVASAIDSVRGIYLGSIDSPMSGRRIVGSSASGVYSDGHLLYVYGGALVAQRFDVSSALLTGERRLIADSVATSYEYYGAFSASRGGTLVYAAGRSRDISRLTWMDTTGRVTGTASSQGYLRNPALSADGRYLAYETYRETDSDIRYVNLSTGASNVIPDDGAQALDPVWSPDGSALAYIVERPGEWNVYRKFINRPDPPELIVRSSRYTVLTDWSSSHGLVSVERSEDGRADVVSRRLASPDRPVILAGGPGSQLAGRVSPDGRLLTYVALESGQPQVYVQSLTRTRQRCQLSVSGGYQPTWGPKAGELYFLTSNGTVMRAQLDVSSATPCALALPRALFETNIRNPGQARSVFDVSLRAGTLLLNQPSTQDGAWLNVILNWTDAVTSTR